MSSTYHLLEIRQHAVPRTLDDIKEGSKSIDTKSRLSCKVMKGDGTVWLRKSQIAYDDTGVTG